MKVPIVQAGIGPMTLSENREVIFKGMEEAMKSEPDIIVLPEMWNSGFFPEKFTDDDDYKEEELQEALSRFARHHQVNLVAGSMTVREKVGRANRSFIYDRKGALLGTYDKSHLFPVGEEKNFFTPGDHNLSFSLDGIDCGIVTCFELRMPEWVRLAVSGKAKILFVPAAWGLSRVPHLHLFAKARAVENQCFVVVVNCTKMGDYHAMGGGGSCIYGPAGEEILMTGTEEAVKTVNLNLEQIEEEKAFFDLYKERRPELYEGLVQ
ncbi:hydrolase, carbon-nitrogen family [Aedoeadaptatus nemausensis]|uniref:Hydrolase, carbon-nitrogen family n=1 Tax=Aedoeadaptatus nemausensis TaxID=2582829 RepID=A0A6V6Y3J0_9FIRM|nr:nitrilase-related carbon-nitrogen hydrolase [Peptoniphilus nemausensis]CAC9929033.1 hydrolase, carbon-nitrogen family [Peptoniphilus nemausensis]